MKKRATLKKTASRGTAPASPIPRPPEDLVKACLANECVLYAGSGLSNQAGLPTWRPLVSEILDWAIKHGYVEQYFSGPMRESIKLGDPDSVADSIVSGLGSNNAALPQHLKELYSAAKGPLPPAFSMLRRIPFSAILTTNLDDLLERTFDTETQGRVYTPDDAEQLLTILSKREFFLLKLYGGLDRPESVIFAPAQYRATVADNLLFSSFMESLFFSTTILFVGASLDGIEAYLSGLKFRGAASAATSAPREHYVFIDVLGTAWQVKAEMLKRRYNIQVIPYRATQGYPEVGQFLEDLAGRVEKAKTPASAQTSAPLRANSWVSRIHLENIGPFENQTIALNPQFNVLLGDNGVGKTNILRAIAVAICGEDAKPFAHRLIKTGMSSGTIVLDITSETIDGNTTQQYTTKILRTDLGAEVRCIPTRPLEAANLFTLGFPPLRNLSWEQDLDAQAAGRERALAADVLPLVTGEPDARLDQLKSWMVELDHQIQSDRTEGRTNTRYTKLRKKFFEVIQQLTPGVKLEFKRYDPRRKTVLVITDDGEVPLESVSQGTASLIGWIGVMLRRLYDVFGDQHETYGDAFDPLQQRAIVLIDEIDAHMHPEWQRLLIPQIREAFPSLQLIATTHSPLIVPSLQKGEIVSLRREPGKRKIVVETPDYDVQGFRTDQVLTSDFFRLPTSLSPDKEEKLMAYTQLSAKSKLSASEQQQLEAMAKEFEITLPAPKERAVARRAHNLISKGIANELDKMDPKEKSDILDEMKVQFEEIMTGSNRP